MPSTRKRTIDEITRTNGRVCSHCGVKWSYATRKACPMDGRPTCYYCCKRFGCEHLVTDDHAALYSCQMEKTGAALSPVGRAVIDTGLKKYGKEEAG